MTTFNPSDKAGGTVLSNGNLTATGTGQNNWARSTTAKAGKVYIEFTINNNVGNAVGIADNSTLTGSYPGANALSFVLYSNGYGGVAGGFPDWGGGSGYNTYTTGNVVSMAFDPTAKLVWFRVNGGNWNGSGSNNPATGVGGISVSAYTGTVHYAVVTGDNLSANTANFGATAFAYTAPSGFTSWDGGAVTTGKIKAWSGSAWNIKPMKVWTGSTWATKAVKMWNGTSWITIQDAVAGPSLSLVQSTEGTSETSVTNISFPTAPASGNLIVLMWSGEAYSYDLRPQSEWFQATVSKNDHGSYVWWRRADGTNSFTYTLDGASTVRSTWMMAEFSGVDQIDVASMNNAMATTTSHATPSLVPTSGERLLIAYMAGNDPTPTPVSDDDWTGWTNSFTHVRSIGFTTTGPTTFGSFAYRIVTGNDSTSYSTGANFPKGTTRQYAGIVAFKSVGDQTATTAPAFRAVSSLSYAARTNSTVDKPTGTVDNDIMLAAVFHGYGGALPPALTPPSGWKLVLQDFPYVVDGGFYARMYLYWKRASSEGSTYTWTHDASNTQIAITSWSGCITSGTPIDTWTYNGNNVSGSGRFGQIWANSTNYRFVAIDHNWSGAAEDPITGWTEHFDTTLLKINSRTMTNRGDSSSIVRASNSPWEGYLVALRGI